MADYRTVSVAFWNDEYTETLSAPERLFFLYLFTSPHINNAGVLKVTPRKMAFESGIDDVATCIERLKTDGKLVEVDGFFWVTGFIKHQTANSPKIAASIIKGLEKVPEQLSRMIRERYPDIEERYRKAIERLRDPNKTLLTADRNLTDALSIHHQYPTDIVSIPSVESESELESEKKNIPVAFLKSKFRDEAYAFADWFEKELKPESVRVTDKVRDDWSLVWYHLRETDGRSTKADKTAMQGAIKWARQDPFWSKNFLTPLKLRKKDGEGVMFIDRFLEASRKLNGFTRCREVQSQRPSREGATEGHHYRLMKPLSMED